MRTTLFNYTTLLLMAAPLLLWGGTGPGKGKYTKEKTIKREFKVNPDALLKVVNSYGSLNLTSWNDNKVVIEVHIKTNGNNEEKVQEKLDEITVEFDANSSMVSARTLFDKDKGGWNWNWGKKSNVNMQINYTIKVPVKNSLQLKNDYGNITLDRIDGHARIDCDYGRLQLGELRGRNNQLNFDYTSKSHIGYMHSGKISADYSGFTLDKAGDLELSADYTNGSIGEMKNLNYSCDYGSLEVKNANNVTGSGDYFNVKLGRISGDVELSADYGAVEIGQMSADGGNINIRTDYTGVEIGYDSGYAFDFEIKTSYGGVSGLDKFNVDIRNVKSKDHYYKGYHGKANSGKLVQISSDYGGINFKSN